LSRLSRTRPRGPLKSGLLGSIDAPIECAGRARPRAGRVLRTFGGQASVGRAAAPSRPRRETESVAVLIDTRVPRRGGPPQGHRKVKTRSLRLRAAPELDGARPRRSVLVSAHCLASNLENCSDFRPHSRAPNSFHGVLGPAGSTRPFCSLVLAPTDRALRFPSTRSIVSRVQTGRLRPTLFCNRCGPGACRCVHCNPAAMVVVHTVAM
jgi:hypothetical protein